MSGLSGQQERIVRAAREFVVERGVPPTMRELADAVGLSSTSTIAYHLRRMREDGRAVETRGGRPGVPTLRPVDAPWP
ncbi:LexA family protein [Streptomyces smyrnaeus]|uniref:LexA family protein n=1 Tax=Streptomyces smyrnaeus TaxID=1387713 RepID=UPI0036A85FEB